MVRKLRYSSAKEATSFLASRGIKVEGETILMGSITPSLRIIGTVDYLRKVGYTVVK